MLLSLIAQHSKRQSSSSLSTDETTSLNGFLLNESMSFLNATAKRSVKFLEFLRRSQDCVESLIVVVSACADFFGKQSDDLSFDCANAHIAHQLLLMIAFRSIFTSSNSLFVSNSVPGSVVPFDFAEFKLILRIALCCDLSAEKSYVVRLLADCRGQVLIILLIDFFIVSASLSFSVL
jgi:hypothetical protein